MKIAAVEYLSDDKAEAIVSISDGTYCCRAFAHPFCYKLGDLIAKPLMLLDVVGIGRTYGNNLDIKVHQSDRFCHDIVGIIHFLQDAPVVKLGNIIFHFGDVDIPKDLRHGDMIRFSVARIDLL